MQPAPPSLVVLAAGESRRLGCCKALVRLREEEPATPLSWLLAAGAGLASPDPPLVVTGADHEAISAAVPPTVEVAHNPDWAAGRTGGIRVARERRPERDLCLAPVDVPLVPVEVFRALATGWAEAGAPSLGWLAPAFEGRHGHPVVLGRELLARLAGWPSDRPLRELRREARPLLAVEVASRAVLDDLDGPADLEALRRRLG